MAGPDLNPGTDQGGASQAVPQVSRARTALGAVVVAAVIAAAAVAIFHQRHQFDNSLHRVGIWALVASFACGAVGVGTSYGMWQQVLRGLGVLIPWKPGAAVFFTSQLGKYLPGSVWPALMQMEAGRARGTNRRTMLAANLIILIMGSCVGLVVACLLLPIYDSSALVHYWWALLALPFLLALLHPRALPWVLDRAFKLLRRPALGQRLDSRAGLRASGWSAVGWLAYGAHLAILAAAVGHGGFSVFVLCTGAMALAIPVGILFIPAPAGAGIRELVLALGSRGRSLFRSSTGCRARLEGDTHRV